MTATQTQPTTPHPDGRNADGRFARGNPGGPGNPYYRRQAQLKRMMLECVTDVDVQSVMGVLLGLARSGDLVAIKLFLEYTVGKPSKEVDPDREELHEWGLQRQTPRLQEVLETMTYSIETPTANQVTRDMIPLVGDCHLKTVGKHIRDGTDYDGTQIAPPPSPPDTNGGKRPGASARCMTAGVQPTDQTGDNGAGPDLNELFAEVVRAVHSVENGPERANRWSRQPDRGIDQRDQPDSRRQ
jgi:hypothetical protein